MAIKGQQLVVTYTAWNTSTNAAVTGDSANHTLYKVKDGGAPATTSNFPSECSSAHMPGVYQLTLTSTEMTANAVRVAGVSSTSNVALFFAGDIITEQGVLPGGTTPNASNGLMTYGTGTGQINPDGLGNVPVEMAQVYPGSPTAGTVGLGFANAATSAQAATALSTAQWTNTLATNLGTLAGHDPGATLGTSTLTQTQVTGGAYNIQSAACVLGDTRLANLDTNVGSRASQASVNEIPTNPLTSLGSTAPAAWINTAAFASGATLPAVATATNLANAPTAGDFTAAMKASLNAATPVVTVSAGTITTVAAGAISDASFTVPGETIGRPTGMLSIIRRIWEWGSNQRQRDRSAGTVTLSNQANNAVLETQVQSTTGSVDTQTQGD